MNRRSLLLAAGAAAVSGCATTPTGNAGETTLASDLDTAVARFMAERYTPGLAVALYSADGAYTRGFGVTDLATGQAADANASFYIASATKPLTALALAILHHRGELNLDATLAAYAPDASFPAEVRADEVRIRQMLCHTSGIDNGPIGFRSAFTGQHDPETLWRLLGASEVNADAPLGTYEYTNVGYNIMTVLTDRKYGVRWQDLLDREVFNAFGLSRTTARMSRAQREGWNVAKPHQTDISGSPRRLTLEKSDQTMHSAGGVVMSANDAVRWLELLVRGGSIGRRQVVAPEVIAATRERIAQVGDGVDLAGYRSVAYGLGWNIGSYRDASAFHHFGGFAGFTAHVSYIPDASVGVAVFANDSSTGQLAAHSIASYTYDRVLGHADAAQRLDAALEAIAADRARGVERIERDRANRAGRQWTVTRPREAYVGAYENENWGRIEVRAEGETLRVDFGAMHAVAEPATAPNAIRVELLPGQGEALTFTGDGERPDAVRNRAGVVFQRA
jgi:CubicO group peptidase (beta-lactamase class C family)